MKSENSIKSFCYNFFKPGNINTTQNELRYTEGKKYLDTAYSACECENSWSERLFHKSTLKTGSGGWSLGILANQILLSLNLAWSFP